MCSTQIKTNSLNAVLVITVRLQIHKISSIVTHGKRKHNTVNHNKSKQQHLSIMTRASSNIVNHDKSEQHTICANGTKAQHAVNLWLADHARRPNHRPSKDYKPREAQKDPETVTFEDDQDTE